MILINGIEQSTVPVSDRGLLYGDGLFETMMLRNREIPLLEYHLDRLYAGLQRLKIPYTAFDALLADIYRLADLRENGIIKIIITRGAGGRGYRAPDSVKPVRIVQDFEMPAYPETWREQGIHLHVCETRLGRSPVLAGIKHLNRLEQVLARFEWSDPDIAEGLMLDEAGNFVEGTMTNLFVVMHGRLLTPPIEHGVKGVMRRVVLEAAAQLGISSEETHIPASTLPDWDECFVCNSVAGIWPVRYIGPHALSLGRMTQQLQSAVQERIASLSC